MERLANLKTQPTEGIGDVVRLGRSERVLVLGMSAAGATVYGAGGVGIAPAHRLRKSWQPSTGRCPAGALLATIEAQRTGPLTLPFESSASMSYVTSYATASIDSARLFALDALDLDRADLIEVLPLCVEERQLLCAWQEVRRGSTGPHTIDRVLSAWTLDPTLCARLLVALSEHVLARRAEIVEVLRRHPSDDGVSHMLLATLSSKELSRRVALAGLLDLSRAGAAHPSARDVQTLKELTRTGSKLAVGTRTPPWLPPGRSGRVEWLVLGELLGAGNAEFADLDELDFASVPKPILEDLIELRAVEFAQLEDPDLRDRWRIDRDPALVSPERLLELGCSDLLGWFAVHRGDPALLYPDDDRLDGARGLARLASGIGHLEPSELAGMSEAQAALATSLADCLRAGSWASASPELLADSSVAELLAGLDAPDPLPSGRGTFLAVAHLKRAKALLHHWEWVDASDAARSALAAAPDEARRDEALNLLAAAQWQQGEAGRAATALRKALEGAYTDSLLVNAGVVAAELDPDEASELFAKLAREAPSSEARALAAERSLSLWALDSNRFRNQDRPIPEALLDPLRALLRSSDLDHTRWRSILEVLVNHDGDWVGAAPDAAFGHRSTTVEARVLRAQAAGWEVLFEELGKALAQSLPPEDRSWVVEQRDHCADLVIAGLPTDDLDDAALNFGYLMLESGLPLDADARVTVRALVSYSVGAALDTGDEPLDAVIRWSEEAKAELPSLPPERRTDLAELVAEAGDVVARRIFIARATQFDEIADHFNGMLDQIRPLSPREIDRAAVFEVIGVCDEFCADSINRLNRVKHLAHDAELSRLIQDLLHRLGDAHQTALSLRREL